MECLWASDMCKMENETVVEYKRPELLDIKDQVIEEIIALASKQDMLNDPNDEEEIQDLRESLTKSFRFRIPRGSFDWYHHFIHSLYFDEEFCYEQKDFFDILDSKIDSLLRQEIERWANSEEAPKQLFEKGEKILIKQKYMPDKEGIITKVRRENCTYLVFIDGMEVGKYSGEIKKGLTDLEFAMKYECGRVLKFEETYPLEVEDNG